MEHTKIIIHLSVGESDGYLPRREYPPPFTSTSVNNCKLSVSSTGNRMILLVVQVLLS